MPAKPTKTKNQPTVAHQLRRTVNIDFPRVKNEELDLLENLEGKQPSEKEMLETMRKKLAEEMAKTKAAKEKEKAEKQAAKKKADGKGKGREKGAKEKGKRS